MEYLNSSISCCITEVINDDILSVLLYIVINNLIKKCKRGPKIWSSDCEANTCTSCNLFEGT
jgi:hypothetical protein